MTQLRFIPLIIILPILFLWLGCDPQEEPQNPFFPGTEKITIYSPSNNATGTGTGFTFQWYAPEEDVDLLFALFSAEPTLNSEGDWFSDATIQSHWEAGADWLDGALGTGSIAAGNLKDFVTATERYDHSTPFGLANSTDYWWIVIGISNGQIVYSSDKFKFNTGP